jgi:hypothetical protein
MTRDLRGLAWSVWRHVRGERLGWRLQLDTPGQQDSNKSFPGLAVEPLQAGVEAQLHHVRELAPWAHQLVSLAP